MACSSMAAAVAPPVRPASGVTLDSLTWRRRLSPMTPPYEETGAGEHRPHEQRCGERPDRDADTLPLGSERVAGANQHGVPDARPDQRQDDVAAALHPQDPCGYGHQAAHAGNAPADENHDRPAASEPALGVVQLGRVLMSEAHEAIGERSPPAPRGLVEQHG